MSQSGLQYKDLRAGSGGEGPAEGDTVVVDWDGYTIGYYGRPFEARNKVRQAHRMDGAPCCYHMSHLPPTRTRTQRSTTQHNRSTTQHHNLTPPPPSLAAQGQLLHWRQQGLPALCTGPGQGDPCL